MYTSLINKISEIITPGQSDIDLIKNSFRFRTVNKWINLIEADSYAATAYYINSGYLRYYKVSPEGEEITIHLYSPGNFATSINSYFTGSKSEEILQTITDCELLEISKIQMEKLFSSSPRLILFEQKLMQSFLIEKEERIIDQITLSAQERFIKLLATDKGILQYVPSKYIASFLGIKPESLSRIKNQITNKC